MFFVVVVLNSRKLLSAHRLIHSTTVDNFFFSPNKHSQSMWRGDGAGGSKMKVYKEGRIGKERLGDSCVLVLGRSELFDLFYKVSLFVVELLIFGSIRVELGQELDKFLLIAQQNVQNRLRLVRVGHEHFEDVESFKLDVARLFLKHVHHQLQVVRVRNIPSHNLQCSSITDSELRRTMALKSTRHSNTRR